MVRDDMRWAEGREVVVRRIVREGTGAGPGEGGRRRESWGKGGVVPNRKW
jgi:hypothetical protein